MADIQGDSGDNTLIGTINDDTIQGREGNDTLAGGSGNDQLEGGEGNDDLYGESGNDTLSGGAGDDSLRDGSGLDTLYGGDGNDSLYLTNDNHQDVVYAGSGNDLIYDAGIGGVGDIVDAGEGNDVVTILWDDRLTDDVTITLGQGQDTLNLAVDSSAFLQSKTAVVTDFAAGANGDVINIDTILTNLSGWDGSSNPFNSVSGYFRLIQDGADTLFEVDFNGGSDAFLTALRLQNTNVSDFISINFAPAFKPVEGVNEMPILSGIETDALNFLENGAAVQLSDTLTVSDIDTATLIGGEVAIASGFVASEDSLSFVDQNGITGSYNSTTGILMLSGAASPEHYQAALRSVIYQNTSDNPIDNKAFSFRVNDGVESSNIAVRQVSFIQTNDDPVVQHSVADQVVTEGEAFSFQFANDVFQDSDGDALTYSASLENGDPLPTWLSFDVVTRTFTGMPDHLDIGQLNIKVIATDNNGGVPAEDVFILDITVASCIISDDFSGGSLNSIWTVTKPTETADFQVVTIGDDKVLQLDVPAGSFQPYHDNNSLRALQAAPNEDFDIVASFLSEPTDAYQMQGIMMEEDADTWIRFDIYSTGSEHRLYAGVTLNGTTQKIFDIGLPQYASDLRVVRSGDNFSFQYSSDGNNWQVAGNINFAINITATGPYAGVHNGPAFTALVDYFENQAIPIINEDGIAPPVEINFNIAEDATLSTVVGQLTGFEGDIFSYDILAGNEGGVFGINATGELIIVDTSNLNYEEVSSYILTTEVTNNLGEVVLATVTINITDVNEGEEPSPGISSDDFSSGVLASYWIITGPTASADFQLVTIGNDHVLQLDVPAGSYQPYHDNNALRALQAAEDEDFDIVAKFLSNPTEAYQLQGIMVEEDTDTWMRFDVYSTGSEYRLYAGVTPNGVTQKVFDIAIPDNAPYLRLVRTGDEFSFQYSFDGQVWQIAGSTNFAINVTSVGPYAGVHNGPAFSALIDYFENQAAPLLNEDGGILPVEVNFDIAEDAVLSTVVGQLTGFAGDSLSYNILSGNSDGIFGINAAGEILVVNADNLDYETVQSYILVAEIINNLGEVFLANVTVNVTDVDDGEAPAIISDDFSGAALGAYWVVTEPVPAADFQIVSIGDDKVLQLDVPAGSYQPYHENNALRVLQATTNEDFDLVVKFLSDPTEAYQLQGLMIEEDTDTWLRFDVYSTGTEYRLYAGITPNGTTQKIFDIPLPENAPYLRVVRAGDNFSFQYSFDEQVWEIAGNTNFVIDVTAVGPYAGVHNGPAFTALVDYFENQGAPIVNEDGAALPVEVSFEVAEDATLSTIVGQISGFEGDSFSYSIQAGNGDGVFDINAVGQVVIVDPGNLDYETTQSYILTTEVTNNLGEVFLALITINITDIDDGEVTAIISDDFNEEGLRSYWIVTEPTAAADFQITTFENETVLQLDVPAGTYEPFNSNTSLRAVQAAPDDDFDIVARFLSVPTEAYQMQGVLVEEDADTWIRFDMYSTGTELRLYGGLTPEGITQKVFDVGLPQAASYLRIIRTGDDFLFQYSFDGESWLVAGSINFSMNVTGVGPYAGVFEGPAFTALVDYFENLDEPLSEEMNIAPVAENINGDINEDEGAIILVADFTDADVQDTHSFILDTTETTGSVVDNNDGTFTYSPAGAFEYLALGETASDTFTYTVSDGNGGSDTKTATIIITGQNDAPVILEGGNVTGDVEVDNTFSVSGSLSATDIDNGATLGWILTNGAEGQFANNVIENIDYTFQVDQFNVIRNGTTIYQDDFEDGVVPPDGGTFLGGFPAEYHTFSTFTESNGRLVMEGSQALSISNASIFSSIPFAGHFALLATDIKNDPAYLNFGLKNDDDITIEARFDLAIPDEQFEAYGIRLTDRDVSDANQQGDDIMELVVRRGADGTVRVLFTERDFTTGSNEVIDSFILDTSGADQITLKLEHYLENPGAVTASFDLINAGVVINTITLENTGQIFGTETPGDVSDDEIWTQAQIIAYSPGTISSSTLQGDYGTLSIDSNGDWIYNLNNNAEAVQALDEGELLTDTFTAVIADEYNGADSREIAITITGQNDEPVIVEGSEVTGDTVEDVVTSVSGIIEVIDIDPNSTLSWSLEGGAEGAETQQIIGDVDYNFQIDQFDVIKNGITIFSDDYTDGAPIPSGGLFSNGSLANYFSGGEFTETGGRAVMDGSLSGASRAALFTSTPYKSHYAILGTNISDDPNDIDEGLKFDDDFTFEVRFDLTIPDERGEGYGLHLADYSTVHGNPGDDVMELVVVRTLDGPVYVLFRDRDYAAGILGTLDSFPLDPAGADQIVLRMEHSAENTGEIIASFDLLSQGSTISTHRFTNTGQAFGTQTPGDTSDDEPWTRASVIAFSPGEIYGHSLQGDYGTLNIDLDGNWTYNLDNSSLQVQALAEGEIVTDTFTAVVSDEHGASDSQEITITVSGTNDAPVVENITGEVGEDSSFITLISDFSDVDATDNHTFSIDTTETAGLVINNNDGTYSYSPNGVFEGLAEGETAIDTFIYTIDDGNGGSDTKTATVTITGQNDAPVIVEGGDETGEVTEDVVLSVSGSLNANDVDSTTLGWTLTGGADGAVADDVIGEVDYNFQVDQFNIVKNGVTIFADDFADGLAPPSGGFFSNGAVADYSVSGGFTESDGRAIMDSSEAVPTSGLFSSIPYLGHFAKLLTNRSEASEDQDRGLKDDDDFTVEARFDLVLPDEHTEAYGIRLTDRVGSDASQPGDDVIELVVRRGGDGNVKVRLSDRNYVTGNNNFIQQVNLDSTGADQIVLRLSHFADNAGEITASFDLLNSGTVIHTVEIDLKGYIFGTDTVETRDNENWTRAQIIAFSPGEVLSSTLEGNYGSLTINQNGDWAYILNNDLPAVQALAEGEQVMDTFTAILADESGPADGQDIVVTVTGTNDNPVVVAIDAGTVSEDDAVITINLLDGQTDIDNGSVLTAENILVTDNLGNPVVFINNGDGTISIDPDQYGEVLTSGESRTVTIAYDISDGFASTSNIASAVIAGEFDSSYLTDNLSVHIGQMYSGSLNLPDGYTAAIVSNPAPGFDLHNDGSYTFDGMASSSPGMSTVIYAITSPENVTIEYEMDINVVSYVNSLSPSDNPHEGNQNRQQDPQVLALSDGGYLVTWTSQDNGGVHHNIYGRKYDGNGNPVSLQGDNEVSTSTNHVRLSSHISNYDQMDTFNVALDDGGFVTIFRGHHGDGLYFIRYDNAGQVVSGFNKVTIDGGVSHIRPEALLLDDGSIFVVWQEFLGNSHSDINIYPQAQIRGQIFDPALTTQTSDSQVLISHELDASDPGAEFRDYSPAKALLQDGNIVVAWFSDRGNNLQSRIYNPTTGNFIAGADVTIQVDLEDVTVVDMDETWEEVDIITTETGGYVLVYTTKNGVIGSNGSDIIYHEFTASGQPVNGVNGIVAHSSGEKDQYGASILNLEQGGSLIAWYSRDVVNETLEIHARVVNGGTLGEEFIIAELVFDNDLPASYTGTRDTVIMDQLADGNIIITYAASGDNYDIETKLLSLTNLSFPANQQGTTEDDVMVGGVLGDTFNGLEGDDVISGLDGNDTFIIQINHGHDTITDFTPGAGTDDILDFQAFNFSTKADALSLAYQDGDDVVFEFSQEHTVKLENVTLAQLDEDDIVI